MFKNIVNKARKADDLSPEEQARYLESMDHMTYEEEPEDWRNNFIPGEKTAEQAGEDAYYGQTNNDYGAEYIHNPKEHYEESTEDDKWEREAQEAQARQEAQERADNPSRLVRGITKRKRRGIKWFIKGTLPQYGLGQIYAGSHTGKSILGIELALSIAAGRAECVLGELRAKVPQKVVYVALEGGPTLESYEEGWIQGHPEVPTDIIDQYYTKLDGDSGNRVQMATATKTPEFQKSYNRFVKYDLEPEFESDAPPVLVIFDVQASLLSNANENDNMEIRELFDQLRDDAIRLNCFFLLIHHAGKTPGGGYRGASSMKDVVDFQLQLDKANKEALEYTFTKVRGSRKEGDIGHYLVYQNEVEEVDENGDVVYDDYGRVSMIEVPYLVRPKTPGEVMKIVKSDLSPAEICAVQQHIAANGPTSKTVLGNDVLKINPKKKAFDLEKKLTQMVRDRHIKMVDPSAARPRYEIDRFYAPPEPVI